MTNFNTFFMLIRCGIYNYDKQLSDGVLGVGGGGGYSLVNKRMRL